MAARPTVSRSGRRQPMQSDVRLVGSSNLKRNSIHGGTGNVTSHAVSTFSQVQLENGASRLYLGVHFGADNVQGQLLGLAIADTILCSSDDPAAVGLRVLDSRASAARLVNTLLEDTDRYGFYGWDGHAR
jgi:hypothetical protein